MDKITIVSKKDLEITWFSGGGGAGGQHKNKHDNCCRIFHPESGVRAQGTSSREQKANQREAFVNLTSKPEFKLWLARKLTELREGKTIEQKVEETMVPNNLKIEVLEEGQWVEVTGEAKEILINNKLI